MFNRARLRYTRCSYWCSIQISILLVVVVAPHGAAACHRPTTILCLVSMVAALALAWRDAPQMRLAHLGVALIFGVLLALEYVVVIGDVGRMNTVFKISFQLWMWIGLLIPLILFWMLRNRRYFSAGVMLLLVGFGLLYLVFAVAVRREENSTGQLTLDGNRFFANLDLPEGSVVEDQQVINYLRANAQGFPVIAEVVSSPNTSGTAASRFRPGCLRLSAGAITCASSIRPTRSPSPRARRLHLRPCSSGTSSRSVFVPRGVGPKSSAIGIVALLMTMGAPACGTSSDPTTTISPVVALDRCVRMGPITESGYNWAAKVSGISCDQVGRFIRHDARTQRIEEASVGWPSDFKAAGYACASSKQPGSRYHGWHVACSDGDRHFAFEWTP